MNIETSLQKYLSNHAGVTALISKRVYPVILPQKPTYPAITYALIDDEGIHAMGSDPNIHSPTFQITSWGKTLDSAIDVASQVLAALKDYTGLLCTGGVNVQRIFYENRKILYDPTPGVWYVPQDFIIWHE